MLGVCVLLGGNDVPAGWRGSPVVALEKNDPTIPGSTGNFRFEPIDDGTKTHFEYEFEMKGVLGKPFWLLARKAVVKGVDGGMSNILAESGAR